MSSINIPKNLTKHDHKMVEQWRRQGLIQTPEDIVEKARDLYHSIMSKQVADATKKFHLIVLRKFLDSNSKHEFAKEVNQKMNEITVASKTKAVAGKLTKKKTIFSVTMNCLNIETN